MVSDFDPLRHTISTPEQILLRRIAQVIQTSSSQAGADQANDASIRFLKQHSSHWRRHVVMKWLARNGIRLPSAPNLPAYWSFDGISRRLQRPPIQIPLIEGHDVDTVTRAEDPFVPADEVRLPHHRSQAFSGSIPPPAAFDPGSTIDNTSDLQNIVERIVAGLFASLRKCHSLEEKLHDSHRDLIAFVGGFYMSDTFRMCSSSQVRFVENFVQVLFELSPQIIICSEYELKLRLPVAKDLKLGCDESFCLLRPGIDWQQPDLRRPNDLVRPQNLESNILLGRFLTLR
jgi:hypothetical protein